MDSKQNTLDYNLDEVSMVAIEARRLALNVSNVRIGISPYAISLLLFILLGLKNEFC